MEPIHLHCPHCRKELRVPAEHAGKCVRCPNSDCRQVIRVPNAPPSADPGDVEDVAYELLGGGAGSRRTPIALHMPVLSENCKRRARQVEAFGKVGHPDVGRLLARVLDSDPDWVVQDAAIKVLVRLREPEAVGPIVRMAHEEYQRYMHHGKGSGGYMKYLDVLKELLPHVLDRVDEAVLLSLAELNFIVIRGTSSDVGPGGEDWSNFRADYTIDPSELWRAAKQELERRTRA